MARKIIYAPPASGKSYFLRGAGPGADVVDGDAVSYGVVKASSFGLPRDWAADPEAHQPASGNYQRAVESAMLEWLSHPGDEIALWAAHPKGALFSAINRHVAAVVTPDGAALYKRGEQRTAERAALGKVAQGRYADLTAALSTVQRYYEIASDLHVPLHDTFEAAVHQARSW